MTLRLAFMGTPDFAVPTLAELIGAGHDIAAVYSQPPRAAGRGMEARKSPVHVFAESHGLNVKTPTSLKSSDVQEELAGLGINAAVVVAYGLILPQAVLDGPLSGCFNLHGSLLPRWRGAAPIQRAVMAGDRETGVMVMRMEAGLDTGPICLAERMEIGPDMTAGELHDALAARGANLVVRAMAALGRDTLDCVAQPRDGVTYAEKIAKSEARIDWSKPAVEVHNHIRGLSPFPGAWFEAPGARGAVRVKVLRSHISEDTSSAEDAPAPGTLLASGLTIACGEGAVRLEMVQRAGKAAVDAEAFLRGADLPPGTVLD